MKTNFQNWLKMWNDSISTQDDMETQNMILEKLLSAFVIIENILHESDSKAMNKARGDMEKGSNQANEKEYLAMIENQKKPWYLSLKKVSSDVTYTRSILNHIYELKNRRTAEVFELRAENAKLRAEISKLNQR